MKKLFTIKCLLLVFILEANSVSGWGQVVGDFQTKNPTGNWSDFNSWNIYNGSTWIAATSGQIPTATTSVYVQAAHTISIDDANAVCYDLSVNGATTSKVSFSSATSVLNVRGNMALFSTAHNCFAGTWTAGAKMVFSGTGAQGFTNLSASSVFINIEVNKSSGTLTTSSNFRFGSFTLTAGNFVIGGFGNEMQGSSSSATITINGGTWTQIGGATKINNAGTSNSPIGAVTVDGGTMVLATSSTSGGGFQITSMDVKNAGTLKLQYSTATGNTINILNSISIDATSTLHTAFPITPLPSSVSFNGIVNYYYTGAQTISAATYSYLKLSGSNTKTLGGSTYIAANGTLEMGSSATLGSSTLNVDPTNTTLLYSSNANQTATNNEWNDNFQNIKIFSGATVSMAGLSKTINGTLTLSSGTLNIGAGGSLTLNGSLASTSGYVGGTNTSDLSVTGTTGGSVLLPVSGNISLKNFAITGTRTLQMNGTSNISLSASFTIASGATYDNGGESQITGSGSISISGKFITRDKDNFTGTNGAIPGITTTLNSGCTVEYGMFGNQMVTARADYQNITFSGSGTKTPSNTFTPAGTLDITGSAILDASHRE